MQHIKIHPNEDDRFSHLTRMFGLHTEAEMLLVLYAIALALTAGTVLWFSISRWWHAGIVLVLWIPLFTPVARGWLAMCHAICLRVHS